MTKRSLLLTLTLFGCIDPANDEPASPETATATQTEPDDIEGTWQTNRVATPEGVQTLTYFVQDGRAILGGDIDLGDAYEIADHAHDRSLVRVGDFRWKNAVIPYVIDPGHPYAPSIQSAINEWQSKTLFRFVPRTTEIDYVDFVYTPNGRACFSAAGRVGGRQDILLAPGCTFGPIVHEIGHAVGLYHEQQRADRDNYVVINTANIDPNFTGAFAKIGASAQDTFAFDFSSVMLYDSQAFSRNGLPTMVRKDNGGTWVRNDFLSAEDVRAVTKLAVPYNAAPIHLQVDISAKCITATGVSFEPGTSAFVRDCSDTLQTQQWYTFATPNAFEFKLINVYTGLCLANQAANGSFVSQQPCTFGNTLENFTTHSVQTYWRAWKSAAGYCLDAPGTTNGSLVSAAACTDGPSQMMFNY